MAAKRPKQKTAPKKRPAGRAKPKAAAKRRKVKPVPQGFHTVTPYLFVPGTVRLIAFLKEAFGAKEIARHTGPNGEILYAQLRIGDSMLVMSDAREPWRPMPSGIYLYVPDTDAVYRRALAAGAVSLMEPADQYYGDRNAGVQDPFGNHWWIGTHIEDVSAAEMERRANA